MIEQLLFHIPTIRKEYDVPPHRQQPPTVRGFDFGEVASALQKSIRRGQEEPALHWAAELSRSGYDRYLLYRLQVIACEDVGLAEPAGFFAEVRALVDAWKEVSARKYPHKPERMFIAQLVLRLARARKSELVGEALCVHWQTNERLFEIPDEALDPHTARGRSMGRKMPEWWDITYHLENRGDVEGDDRYTERAIAAETSHRRAYDAETLSERAIAELLDVPGLPEEPLPPCEAQQ